MGERPIIFYASMVCALLDGRKTQTRRMLKSQPEQFVVDDKGTLCDVGLIHVQGDPLPRVTTGRVITRQEVRFAVGDHLWVKEAHALVGINDPGLVVTRADYPACVPAHYENLLPATEIRWRPSIHMHRSNSRLTPIVTDVRVERLQVISEEDALAEGVDDFAESLDRPGSWDGLSRSDRIGMVQVLYGTARRGYQQLWEMLHGTDAWAANPWVAVITFAVERRNIDAPSHPSRSIQTGEA